MTRGADFPLIAPAIAASGPHDVIQVRRGVYREDLMLDQPVSIVGEPGMVLFGTGSGTVIDDQGAWLRNSRADDRWDRHGRLQSDGCGDQDHVKPATRLSAIASGGAFYGIVVAGAAGNLIEGTTISPVWPTNRSGGAVTGSTSIARLTIRSAGTRCQACATPSIFSTRREGWPKETSCAASRYGLHDMFSDNTRIAGNVFQRVFGRRQPDELEQPGD